MNDSYRNIIGDVYFFVFASLCCCRLLEAAGSLPYTDTDALKHSHTPAHPHTPAHTRRLGVVGGSRHVTAAPGPVDVHVLARLLEVFKGVRAKVVALRLE